MRNRKSDERGFTLIEAIFTLMLVAVTATMAGMWIVSVANGYIFTKMNADTVQKAQLAMTRLTMELTRIRTVDAGTATQVTYTRSDPSGTTVSGVILKNGNLLQLQLNGGTVDTLADGVSDFTLNYCSDNFPTLTCEPTLATLVLTDPLKMIEVTLSLTGANNTASTFTKRVVPRNL